MGFGLDDISNTKDLLSSNPLNDKLSELNSIKPSVPETPSMIEFENFSTGTACIESAVKHSALTLKLRSAHLGAEVQVDGIKDLLEAMLGIEHEFFQIPELTDFNMDLSLSKMTDPKIGDLPQCLSDTITGKLSTAGPGLMKDILNPFNKAIGGINSLTSAATPMLNSALNSFAHDTNALIGMANDILKNALTSQIDPTDKVLFEQLDSLYEYLENTGYIQLYKNWKDMTKCIQTNCKPIADEILTDDFMWYDEKHTEFIMPIDLNNGTIHIVKFFQNLTNAQKSECNKIEQRYRKYQQDKIKIARAAAEKLRIQKVKEDRNPFASIVSKMTSSRNDIVNGLF